MILAMISEVRTKNSHVCPCFSLPKERSVDRNPLPASSNHKNWLRLSGDWYA